MLKQLGRLIRIEQSYIGRHDRLSCGTMLRELFAPIAMLATQLAEIRLFGVMRPR